MQVPFHIITFLPFTYVLPSISSTFPQKGPPPWSPYITQTLASLSPKMLPISFLFCLLYSIRELKQQRWWRLQKCHLNSEFARLQTLSRLFQLFHCVKCWQLSLELNLKDCIKSSGKEKESCCLAFTSSTKHEIIRWFHVEVVQQQQRNVLKSMMHVQSCCFANLNLLLFSHSYCSRHRHYLSSLLAA